MIGLPFVPNLPGGVGTDFHPTDRIGERLVTGSARVVYTVASSMVMMMFVGGVIVMRLVVHIETFLGSSLKAHIGYIPTQTTATWVAG